MLLSNLSATQRKRQLKSPFTQYCPLKNRGHQGLLHHYCPPSLYFLLFSSANHGVWKWIKSSHFEISTEVSLRLHYLFACTQKALNLIHEFSARHYVKQTYLASLRNMELFLIVFKQRGPCDDCSFWKKTGQFLKVNVFSSLLSL